MVRVRVRVRGRIRVKVKVRVRLVLTGQKSPLPKNFHSKVLNFCESSSQKNKKLSEIIFKGLRCLMNIMMTTVDYDDIGYWTFNIRTDETK